MSQTRTHWTDWIRQPFASTRTKRRPAPLARHVAPETLEDRALLSAASITGARWTINADIDSSRLSETIVVDQNPDDPSQVRVTINGSVFAVRSADRLRSITINAGAGDDTVNVQLPPSLGSIVVTVNGGGGNDILNAGNSPAILRGGDGDDILNGGEGDDRLEGGKGSDILNGNGGNDQLFGEDGEDNLRGGTGIDRLVGGKGRDWIYSTSVTDNVKSDRADMVAPEEVGGLQRFSSQGQFQTWLEHSAVVSQRLGYGNVFYVRAGSADVDSNTPQNTAGSGHSDTNTQVDGVDEQDIVETDGNYIYTIRGNELLIIDVQQPEDSNIVSRIDLSGWGTGMFLDGDRLTVISTVNSWGPWLPYVDDALAGNSVDSLRCAPPYWNWRPKTAVVTYDISDRADVKVVEETTFDGTVNTSRAVDGRIYLVVNNSLWFGYDPLPYPNIPTISSNSAPGVIDWKSALPQYSTKSYDAAGNVTKTSGSLLDYTSTWAPNDPLQNSSMTSIVMIDIHQGDAGIDDSTTVFGMSGEVYASTEAIYIAETDWSNLATIGTVQSSTVTNIYKFDLTTDGSTLAATGRVDGVIVDQFSMDEHDGYFRIATTSNAWQNNQSCNVFVLEQREDTLFEVSSLTGLSPTERIYSARFIGDHVYLSTFLQIDPLLSIDLGDPENPFVAGELKVPGYSSYLQQWGNHYLISIGQDADPQTGRVTGLQLSMFDISDSEHPTLVGTYKISTAAWSSYSQAEWDHLAFSLFDAEGILAIPVSGWSANSEYTTELQVFQLDGEEGFQLLGTVEHDSPVQRSLRIGDQLFSLSDSSLKINSLWDPTVEVADLTLPEPSPIPEPNPDPFPIPIIIGPIALM